MYKNNANRAVGALLITVNSLVLAINPTQAFTELGAGALFVDVDAAVAYDSNIFTNSAELDDFVARLTPMLTYEQDRGVLNLTAGAGVQLNQFLDYDEQNSEDLIGTLSLSGFHRPSSKTDFRVDTVWREVTDASVEIGNRIEREVFSLAGEIDFRLSEKAGLRFGAGYGDTDYDQPVYIDSADRYGRVDAIWFYSEKLFFKAGYRKRDIDYDANGIDRETDTFIVGAEGDLSAKLTGLAEVGFVKQDAGLDDFLYYSLGLNWASTQKRSFSLLGTRDNQISVTGQNMIVSSLSLEVDQTLTDRLTGNAFIGYGELELDGPFARDDEVYKIGAGMRVEVGLSSYMGADIVYENRDSTSAESDYNRVVATVDFNTRF